LDSIFSSFFRRKISSDNALIEIYLHILTNNSLLLNINVKLRKSNRKILKIVIEGMLKKKQEKKTIV